ncbi:MAG: serine O-acetyltransferase EpsC [Mucinivorans sp.]
MDISRVIERVASDIVQQDDVARLDRPSPARVARMMELLREVIFAHHYLGCCSAMVVGQKIREVFRLLEAETSSTVAINFIESLPEIRNLLFTDVKAVMAGDPAATSPDEVILCYPAITAMLHHRVAHSLYNQNVLILARMISEIAHSATGIDIHPGATIGEYFSIDHGTGVVVGQTTIIGSHVRLYQGVTLGARSFISGENGELLNTARHPIIEDDVVIYSNTSVLGRITIGRGSVIGGNVWLTRDVPRGSKITQSSLKISK